MTDTSETPRDPERAVPGPGEATEQRNRPDTGLLELRLSPVTTAAVAMIAVQLLVRLALVPQSFFWQDDYIHLDLARRSGLTWKFLIRDYNDHLEVIPNAIYWLLAQVTTSSWAPAAVVLLLLQLTASVLMLVLLRALVGDRLVILLPLAVYLFTPLFLVPLMWLAAGLEAWTLQIALLGTALGMLKYTRSGNRWWLIFALAIHAFGLLSWEKALLVLPAVLGFQLLLQPPAVTFRERLRVLRAHRFAWLAHAVVAAGYAVLYATVTDGSERVPAGDAGLVAAARDSVFRVLVPGLFGGPWTKGGSGNTLFADPGSIGAIVFALAAAAVVALTVRRSGWPALLAWGGAVGYLCVDVGLLLVGRTNFLLLVARDPRYVADAVAVFVVVLAFVLGLPERGRDEVATDTRRTFATNAGLAALLAVSGLITTALLAPGLRHTATKDYVESALAATNAIEGDTVVNTAAPPDVVGSGDLRMVLTAMGRDAIPFDRPGSSPLIFDAAAKLVPVRVTDPVWVNNQRGPEGCGWLVDTAMVPLASGVVEPNLANLLQVGYVAGANGVLTIRTGASSQSVNLEPGVGTVSLISPDVSGAVVASFDSQGAGPICLSDLVVGTASP